jgi:hypothetical protein
VRFGSLARLLRLQRSKRGVVVDKEGDRILETPVEARAGFLDRSVFVVLAVSVALAVTAMALTYAGFFVAT